jgi:(E)-2-((N-methylformamido)methylene)succinate hydrolase
MSDLLFAPFHGRRGEAGNTAYRREGRGSAVLFIHGVGLNGSIWFPQIEAFAKRHTVIAMDIFGHGRSTMPPPEPSLSDYADQVEQLRISLEIPGWHVVGHSMGALIALEYALLHPKTALSISALNAVFQRTPEQRAAVEQRAASLRLDRHNPKVHQQAIGRWFGNPPPSHLQAVASLARNLLDVVDPAGYAAAYHLFAGSDRAHSTRLTGLVPPALFFTGALDPNSTPAMSEAMARLAPRGQFAVLDAERHMMALTAPAEVNDQLLTFIGEAERSPRG